MKKIALVFTSITFSLISFEILLKIFNPSFLNQNIFYDNELVWDHFTDIEGADEFFNKYYTYDMVLGYKKENDNVYNATSSGLIEIAFVGDSISEHGFFITPLPQLFNDCLSKNTKLVNYGTVGYNTYQELTVIKNTVLPTKPDLVVLQIEVLNDFEKPAVFVSEKEQWLGVYSPGWWFNEDLYNSIKTYKMVANVLVHNVKKQKQNNFDIHNVQTPLKEIVNTLEQNNIDYLLISFPNFVEFDASTNNIEKVIASLGLQDNFLNLKEVYREDEASNFEKVKLDPGHPNPIGGIKAANAIAPIIQEKLLSNADIKKICKTASL